MKKQLTGFAWMFFGLLLYTVMGGIWLPAAGDYLWPVLSMLCGITGLVIVIRRGAPRDWWNERERVWRCCPLCDP